MQRPSSPPDSSTNPIIAALQRRFGTSGWVSLETFVEAALYDPDAGYYRRSGPRVGHRANRDFYTASSLGTVFSELVVASVCALLPDSPAHYRFVEIGAEPDHHLLHGLNHPFAASEVVRLGKPLDLGGPCVVFSNELFDAQPFRQFQRIAGVWREMGLRLDRANPVLEPLPAPAPLPDDLPANAPEGYVLDYPSGARELAQRIAALPWNGLFIAIDYGLPWTLLAHDRPHGTARTYREHRQGLDLLAEPGSHDITHHICWDHLAQALTAAGFETAQPLTQESFLTRHAMAVIGRLIEDQPGTLSPARQTLKTLLHPENMGMKFQVLTALRPPPTA